MRRLHAENGRPFQNPFSASTRLVPWQIGMRKFAMQRRNSDANNHRTRQDQLAQLTGLTISLNHIVELPAEMCLLSALTRLDATNNEIVHIPDAALQLPRLEELELAFNRIVVLPPALGDLTALHRLTLQVHGSYVVHQESAIHAVCAWIGDCPKI